MVVNVKLTPEQLRHHDRIILALGDAYEFLCRRLVELGNAELLRELTERFGAAPGDYAQYQVIEEIRRKVDC